MREGQTARALQICKGAAPIRYEGDKTRLFFLYGLGGELNAEDADQTHVFTRQQMDCFARHCRGDFSCRH
ncbi:protein of unknown function [Candidatus Filomicrobium marinum]|nr:protein of unknown function [Candidatus Filomicrobium marinum]